MTRRLISTATAAAAAALSLLAVAPAAQGAPPETCPGPFEAYTLPELVQLAEQVGGTAAAAEAIFGDLNRNGDELICVQDMTTEKQPLRFNFIDNIAV